MASFVGEHGAKLDDKGRLILPSQLKSIAEDAGCMRFKLKKSLYVDCIELYLESEWDTVLSDIRSKLNPINREDDMVWRYYLTDSGNVTPDEKLGRINIPNHLLEKIGVIKEVVFFGAGYKIEVWAKERWESNRVSEKDMVTLIEKRLG